MKKKKEQLLEKIAKEPWLNLSEQLELFELPPADTKELLFEYFKKEDLFLEPELKIFTLPT